MKPKFRMIDYEYEQAQMKEELKQERKVNKRDMLNRKLDRCTDVKEYLKLSAKLK
jgi:hypothetical protein